MRLIDADALRMLWLDEDPNLEFEINTVLESIDEQPTVEAEPVRHGTWVLEAHNERVNYRWSVTAKCPECGHDKGEIYAGFFPGFPESFAEYEVLACAESVRLDNFCPNCGAKMDGGVSDD